ncbi:oxidoreductase [Hamadaea sp. NPDC051192]|uniref:oxidoreductase n=1 Tax=Hamadaea sp. NPDC051192 TaxID=3154940 RepID=UPI003413992A
MAKTSSWTAADLPDLTGRTAVVTGASSGLGITTTAALARAGARVVLAVRNIDRGRTAAASITGARGPLEVRELDVADLSSICRFAETWQGDLDLLINNAGVMALPESATADGFETQFATNHLGPFALTNLLLPHITDRVVTLSSNAHRIPASTRINFDNPNLTGEYNPNRAYSQSKLAVLLFTLELQSRLTAVGSPVRALAAHPGWSQTNLTSGVTSPVRRGIINAINAVIGQDSTAGALPTLYAAVEDLPGGSYVGPDGSGERTGGPTLVGRSEAASDPESAHRLWALSEKMTGIGFPQRLRTAAGS